MARNMETDSRYEEGHDEAWAHLDRERGSVDAIRDTMARFDRDGREQCIFLTAQMSVFMFFCGPHLPVAFQFVCGPGGGGD